MKNIIIYNMSLIQVADDADRYLPEDDKEENGSVAIPSPTIPASREEQLRHRPAPQESRGIDVPDEKKYKDVTTVSSV